MRDYNVAQPNMRTFATYLGMMAVLTLGCGDERGASEPRGGSAEARRDARPPVGEEPLETETLRDDSVVTLPEAPRAAVPPPSPSRPCNWAAAWSDPSAPKPLLAGVGGVPNPVKVNDAPIEIPAKEPVPEGQIVVELIVLPDGSVGEASVVRTTTPPWPEAERAVLEAVRRWRYEGPKLDGTPVAVCATVMIQP